ncbi:hypothetical protein Vadar_004008 [Vaccinium darrowii]|uniref:Uncharacterized protein n=1 Tax=Vaccinium darrowii TaxID=229202 RepID=A0ACB7XY30_9ERIC|nr:hypothetical protein Vadar_004008 [Vaccinium darrowii]
MPKIEGCWLMVAVQFPAISDPDSGELVLGPQRCGTLAKNIERKEAVFCGYTVYGELFADFSPLFGCEFRGLFGSVMLFSVLLLLKQIDSNPEYFTIKLNHGGNLVKEDMVEYYVGGSVNYIDYCDNDRISKTELHAMSKEVGIVQNLTNQLVELYIVDSNLESPITVDVGDGLEVVDWGDGLQDGLVNAIRDLLPCVEHRHCVRHLHSNMKSVGFTGQAVKDMLWSLARATYMGRFRGLMEEFKKEDEEAFKWLAKKEAHHWSRLHFNVASKCDMLLNNICKSFNAAILDARDKPMLTMLERIRIYLIRFLVRRRASVEKWHDQLGPKIVKFMDKNMAECKEYIVVLTGDNQFEVRGFHGNQYCVDMNGKTCSCRRLDLTGIPCSHALAVFRESKKKVQDIVHDYYQKQTYINTYNHVIYPMNGMDMWEKMDKPPIQPPHYTKKSGRPKKCRRREADKPPAQSDGTKKMKRYLRQLSCRRCGGKGHNVRTCSSAITTPMAEQCSQPISRPIFTPPTQPISTRIHKAPPTRGGAGTRTKGGAGTRGGASRRGGASTRVGAAAKGGVGTGGDAAMRPPIRRGGPRIRGGLTRWFS